MKQWDGYLHTNGTIQVRRMPFGESLIDTSSPFCAKYLGSVEADTWEDAELLLRKRS